MYDCLVHSDDDRERYPYRNHPAPKRVVEDVTMRDPCGAECYTLNILDKHVSYVVLINKSINRFVGATNDKSFASSIIACIAD